MDDCIIWPGYLSPTTGYGTKYVGGGKYVGAHRWTWEQANGPIPAGMLVMHTCDNRPCVNLEHLRLGTHADNIRDMYAKGRGVWPHGEAHWSSKLTDDIVRDIRASSESNRALAKRYGVDRMAISKARRGETWKHINPIERKNE